MPDEARSSAYEEMPQTLSHCLQFFLFNFEIFKFCVIVCVDQLNRGIKKNIKRTVKKTIEKTTEKTIKKTIEKTIKKTIEKTIEKTIKKTFQNNV